MQEWHPISTAPEHVTVRTRVSGAGRARPEMRLKRLGQTWFTDGLRPLMVHHIPTEWRPG